jgi:hypothetical protein
MKNLSYLSSLILVLGILACQAPKTENKEAQAETVDHNEHEHHMHESMDDTEDDFLSSRYQEVHEYMASTHFTIKYTAPVVKNRVIFGGLVAYDEVWVTGAHKATNISFDTKVAFGEVWVDPGTYAIFTIPGKEAWTFILNTRYEQHLADEYDSAEDVLRLQLEPQTLDERTERLRYAFLEEAESVYLRIAWDHTSIRIPLQLEKP